MFSRYILHVLFMMMNAMLFTDPMVKIQGWVKSVFDNIKTFCFHAFQTPEHQHSTFLNF